MCKVYEIGDAKVKALKDVNLKIEEGEFTIYPAIKFAGKPILEIIAQ